MAQFAIDEILTTGIQISGFVFDVSNNIGTNGYVLTSTSSGVMWQQDSSNADLSALSGQIAATGSLLNNRINSLSGYVDGAFVSGSGVANYVARWSNTKELITGSIYDLGTGVGIGTTRPVSLLTVGAAGSTSAANGISFGGDVSANLFRDSNASIATDGGFYAAGRIRSADYIQFNSNLYSNAFTNPIDINVGNSAGNAWLSAIRFNQGGYVGIGTNQPSGKLHVVSSVAGETVFRADGTNGTLFSVVDDLSDSLMSVNNSAGLPVLEVFADDRIIAGQYGSGDFVLKNNKIGIGVLNPGEKLDVNGNIRIGLTTTNTIGTSNVFSLQTQAINIQPNSSTDTLYIRYLSAGNYQLQTATASANGGSLHLQPYGGNVGIGLINPEATSALHIKNLAASAKVTIESADASESLINFSAQNSEYSVGFVRTAGSVNSLRFCAADNLASNEVMRLQNSNVGIGTTNPNTRLHIFASGSSVNLLKGVTYNDSSASFNNASLEYYDISTGNVSTITKSNYNAYFNKRGSSLISGFTIGNYNAYTQIDSGYVGLIWDYSSRIEIRNQATANTLAHFVADAGYVTAQGGVLGQAVERIGLFIRAQNQSSQTLTNQYGIYVEDLGGSTNNYAFYSNVSAGSNKYNIYSLGSANNYLAGNVGIGTTNPSGKLSVDFAGTGAFSVCDSLSSNVRVTIGTVNNAGFTYGLIQTYQHNTNAIGVSPLNIQPFGGKVGIGVTNPDYQLTVIGQNQATANLTDAGNKGGSILVASSINTTDQGGAVLFATKNDANLYTPQFAIKSLFQNGMGSGIADLAFSSRLAIGNSSLSEVLRIKNNGNVGIGTTTVGNKLTVYTTTQYDGYYLRNANGVVGTILGTSATNDDGTIGLYSNVVLKTNITANGDSYFNGGNVGVGVTNPSNKIQVSGGGVSFTTSTGLAVPMIGLTAINVAYIGPYATSTDGNAPTLVVFNQGSSVQQTYFYSSGRIAMVLNKEGRLNIAGNASNTPPALLNVGPTSSVDAVSGMSFGNDSSANLYRSAASTIKTDGSINVVGTATLGPTVINGGTLPSSPTGSTVVGFNYNVNVGSNISQLNLVETRFATGSDWLTTSTKIQKRVDAVNLAYIEFNPSGAANGMAFGVGFATQTEAMRILSNGNIGVGTTNPGSPLDVYKNTDGQVSIYARNPNAGTSAYAGLALGNNTSSNGGGLVVFGSNWAASALYNPNGTYLYSNLAGGVTIASEHASGPIILGTSNTERMRISSAGNVGIGTSTLGRRLHVFVDTGPVMRIQSSGSNASIEFVPSSVTNSLTNWLVGAQQNISNAFEITPSTAAGGTTFSNPALLIRSNGNVGIATTLPGYSLQIGQNTSGNNIDYSLGILRHGTLSFPGSWTSNPAFKIIDLVDGGPSNVDINGIMNLELPRFQASDTNAEKASLFLISFDTALGPFRIDGKGNTWVGYDRVTTGTNLSSFSTLIYGGLAVGDTYQTTTLSNGQAIFKGSVGIGVTNPACKLDVAGTIRSSTNEIYGFGASDNVSLRAASTLNVLGIYTSNVERLRLAANGYFGIGTDNPSTLLSIGRAGSTAAASGITFGEDAQANLYRSAEDTIKTDGNLNVVGAATLGPTNINGGTLGASPVNIALTGFTYAVNNGNISQLTFVEKRFATGGDWTTATTRIQKRVDVTDQAYIEFNPSGSTYGMALGVAAGGSLEALRIISNGRIGIGTTNPSAKLSLNKGSKDQFLALDIANNDQKYALYVDQDNNGSNSFSVWDATNSHTAIRYLPSSAGYWQLYTNNIERVRIDNSGNVGIGTTNPNGNYGKLTVAGGIRTLDDNNSKLELGRYSVASANSYIKLGANSNALHFTNAADNADLFTILNSGNVGINNSSPAYKLDVNSSIVSRSTLSSPRFSNAGTYVYGVTNSPTWNQSCGTAVNNSATAPDGTTSAGTYTLTSSCGSYDMFQTIAGLTVGRVYTIGMWVKLGTATNFCLVVNNTVAWNTIGGKAFDSNDGLSTGKWTHISYTFTAISPGSINLHLGYHAETAVAQQTAGTVFIWNIEMTEFSSTWIGNVEDEIRLPGSSIWTSRGSVGVGQTNPLSKFVVSGGTVNTTTYTTSEARISDGSLHLMKTVTGGIFESIRAMNADTTVGTTVRFIAASTSDPFNNGNGGKVFIDAIRTSTNMDLAFSLNNVGGAAPVERVRFMGNGNVGIGTTSPSTLLHAHGNSGEILRLSMSSNYTAGAGPQISFWHRADEELASIRGVFNETSQGNRANLLFGTRTSDALGVETKMTILHNGNVGIGNTIPTGLLNVIRNSSTAQPIAFFKELFGTPPATNILLLERGNNLTAANQLSSNAGLRIRDHLVNYSLSVEDHNSNVNFAISGTRVMLGSRGTDSLLNIGGVSSTLPASGITFGQDPQVNLYRIAEDVLRTDANLNVLGYVSVGGYIYTSAYIQVAQGNIYPGGYTSDLNLNIGNTAGNNWETAIKIKPGSYVGIGTTQPTGKLHVVSTVAGETVLRADGTNGTLFSVTDDLSDSLMSVNNSAGLPVLEVFADDRVVAGQYGSGDFVIRNNKVGIGATNPLNKLSVIGAASIGSTSYNIAAPSNGLLVEGNVGIGTTSVGNPLEVYGTSMDPSLTPSAASIFSVNSLGVELAVGRMVTSPFSIWLQGKHATVGGNLTYPIVLNPLGNNVGIGTTNPSQLLHISSTTTAKLKITADTDNVDENDIGGIEISQDGGVTTSYFGHDNTNSLILGVNSTTTPNIYIGTRNDGTNFVTSADAKVTILNGGNVGIGTADPQYKLDVYSTNQDVARFYNNQTTFGLLLGSTSNTSFANLLWQTSGGNAQFFKNASSASWGGTNSMNLYTSNGGIAFHPAGTQNAVFFNTNGNVGINTTAPTNTLQVVGQIAIRGDESADNAKIHIQASDNSNRYTIETDLDGNTANDLLIFRSNTADNMLVLKGNGNIGINTTNPADKIHISGGGISFTSSTGLAIPMLGVTATNVAYVGPYTTTAEGVSPSLVLFNQGASVQQTWFYSSGRVAMVLNKEGRLHIGNTNNTPNCLLSVGPSSSTTAVSGMCFGNDAQANLYRSAEDTIKTDGNLVVAGTTSLNGHIYGQKTVALSTASWTTVLTVNMLSHNSCYVKIGAFGDWSNHSAIAFVSELFIQNGDNAGYGEPGIIITAHDNTRGAAGDKIDIQIVDPAAAGTQNFLIQLKLISATSSTNSSLITYHVMGQQASVT